MNMSCFEGRQYLAAEPDTRSPEVLAHIRQCPACAAKQYELQQFDSRIQKALAVSAPEHLASRVLFSARRDASNNAGRSWLSVKHPRWLAAAATLLLTIGLAGGWWWQRTFSTPLPQALVAHIWHEPQLLTLPADSRASASKMASVLNWGGAQWQGSSDSFGDSFGDNVGNNASKVQHAGLCLFRGRLVAHLVVASEAGPVTVLLLPQVSVKTPSRFTEQGFSGVLVPRGKGSIAVLSRSSQSSQAVASRYAAMIRWQG